MKKPYVVSEKNGAYYCHKRGFPYIPVFGSIGSRSKAQRVCNIMNASCGFSEDKHGKYLKEGLSK